MSAENDKQTNQSFSEAETQNLAKLLIEDKTLIQPAENSEPNLLTHEAEPTYRLPKINKEASTIIQDATDTEPTKILTDAEDGLENDRLRNENALKPSRVRFALVCLLFIFAAVYLCVNAYKPFMQTGSLPKWSLAWNGERFVITTITPDFSGDVQIGDEILSVDNQPIDKRYKYRQFFRKLEADNTYSVQLRRNNQAYEIKLVPKPLPFSFTLNLYLVYVFIPAVFLITAITVFLFKPNDKLIVLVAVSFSLLAMSIAPPYVISFFEESPFISYTWQFGNILELLNAPVLLHFFLLFPKPSLILRRFPQIKFLIYLPFMLYVVPVEVGQGVAYSGLTTFDIFLDYQLLNLVDFFFPPYLFLSLLVLISNYRNAEEQGKRKLHVLLIGVSFAIVPIIVIDFLLVPIELLLDFAIFSSADWKELASSGLAVMAPPVFAYAVVYHQVIPISFIIRRGLQYVLTKNALRVLLVVPIMGIVWIVASNPNRTLSEIILNNSVFFYLCSALASALVLLNRLGLREWVDKRFFREQYDQEKILRELIEAVKVIDSRTKLARLVSSKIQSALHPTSVYMFFQEDSNSDFSLGYSTSEVSLNLKLAAESPLLSLMQQETGTIEFPTRKTDDLPNFEKRWLREIDANLLVPMYGSDGKLAGIFSLGEKMSQIPYTQRDKEMLETLANQIALVHENLRLKDRMRREQKIKAEVLARFDEGNINILKECLMCGRCFDRESLKCTDDDSNLTFTLPVERTIENRYRLERLLGKGGMGAVYKATDLRINRQVAVKILSGAMFGNRNALRRFEREAQTAGKLNHRNIVTIFDYGVLSTEGAFLVMELVEGETLSGVLKRKGKLDAKTIVAWFAQVLDGVDAAHKAGIVHRDLKPDNIFVTRNEDNTARLCILDFGLARFNEHEFTDSLSLPGTVMGTLGYMPPEQLRGEKTDERSDLFATGVIIYECMHGEKPFSGKNYQEIMIVMSKEIKFDRNEPLSKFFEQSLALKPERRFASASKMKEDLLHSEIG